MSTLAGFTKKDYPHSVVEKCEGSFNGIIRTSKQRDAAIEKLTLYETASPKLGEVYDVFQAHIFQVDPDTKTAAIGVQVSLQERREMVSIVADIVDLSNQCIVASIPEQIWNDEWNVDFEKTVQIPKSVSVEDLALIAYVSWGTDEVHEEFAMLKRYSNSYNINHFYGIRYHHVFPKNESSYRQFPSEHGQVIQEDDNIGTEADNREDAEHIVVALYRKPEDTSDLDYLCLFGGDRDYPYLLIPGKGDFIAPGNGYFLTDGSDAPAAYCTISPKQGKSGGAMVVASSLLYEPKDGVITIKPGRKKISYEMISSWNVVYKGKSGFKSQFYDYEFTFLCTVATGNLKKRCALVVGSAKNERCIKQIKPIVLKYGCFAEHTQIEMEDGSTRAVQDIHIGDRVRSGLTYPRAVRVTNAWRGTEESMYQIHTAKEGFLAVTGLHMLQTDQGMICADQITTDMSLIRADESPEKVVLIKNVKSSAEIFHLDVDSSNHTIIANGFISGDFYMQNNGSLHAKRNRRKEI